MKYLFNLVLVFGLIVSPITYAVSQEHVGKTDSHIQLSNQTGCVSFQLTGVTQADPVKQDDPWFVIDSVDSKKEALLSMLMLAYASGQTVKVATTGTLNKVCGYARVDNIRLY